MWEKTITVGLRSNYISSCLALKMMVPKREGLIVNISSAGGLVPLFNPLYCVGKEGVCMKFYRMIEWARKWEGFLKVKIFRWFLYGLEWLGLKFWQKFMNPELQIGFWEILFKVKRLWSNSESVYFSGRAVLHLALGILFNFKDKNVINKSGKIQIVPDLAAEYGFSDVDGLVYFDIGKFPASLFSIKALIAPYMPTFSYFIPHFLRVPKLLLSWWYGRFWTN